MNYKERYQNLKEKGICVYCKTASAQDGKTTCRSCREKQRIQTAEKRKALKKLGFCTECGINRIFGSEAFCPECSAKKYIQNRKRNNIEYGRQYQHDRKEKLKSQGICIKCGKRKAEPGKTCCKQCSISERMRARRYRGMDISRSERPNYSLCYFCGKQIESGRICELCRERITQNLPKTNPNEYWRKQEQSRILEVIGNG